MSWQVHRPGEGRWARLGTLFAMLALGVFGAYRFYMWVEQKVWATSGLPDILEYQLSWADIGSVLIVLFFSIMAYRICYTGTKSSDFLVEAEIELRKVTWPEWKPVLKPSTELWGSAYVVIIVVFILTAFIFFADLGLGFLAEKVFLS